MQINIREVLQNWSFFYCSTIFLLQVVRFMIRSAAVCNITFSSAQPGKIKLIQSRLRLLSLHFPSASFLIATDHIKCVCVCVCVCVCGSLPSCIASHPRSVVSPRLQEGSRRGQEVPQGLRSGAQGSVVHRLPLEKSLPTLPRLKTKQNSCAMERVWDTERRMDEWAIKETFIRTRI